MSVTKLESLPNEIMINIFEEYMNGVDVLVAFANLKHQHFNAIISQCRKFNFNFINCRKDYFHHCIRHLPMFIGRIEELVLSEQNTPGQIYAFLSFYPSFHLFKRLRKLYLQLNGKGTDWLTIQRAILSLAYTPIHTLLIKVVKTDRIPTLNYVVSDIFRLKDIKHIVLISNFQRNQWGFLMNISSSVEYLTNFGISCEFQHLQTIFRSAPNLKYLNIRLTSNSHCGFNHLFKKCNNHIISMPKLHTVILSFGKDDPTTFDLLAQYLKAMPVLRRLQIKAHSALLNANLWESLLKVSLPLLRSFVLKTTTFYINEDYIEHTLAAFDTPFWRKIKNFFLMITKHERSNSNRFGLDKMYYDDQDEYNQPVIQWWIVPSRSRTVDIPTDGIMKFGISNITKAISNAHYFLNLKHLIVYNLDNGLLKWFSEYS